MAPRRGGMTPYLALANVSCVPRELRMEAGQDPARPKCLLDGEPVNVTSIRHVHGGGGVWIDGQPVFDVIFVGMDGAPRFAVPPEDEAADWYDRLDSGPHAFVDWSDIESIKANPALDQERIRRLPGMAAVRWERRLIQVLSILHRNAAELRQLLAVVDSPDGPLLLDQANPYFAEHSQELLRQLHNTLASMTTRVDLQRIMVRDEWNFPAEWREIHRERLDELIANGVLQFFHDLRNFMLHRELPVATYTLRQDAGVVTFTLELPVSELLSRHAWKVQAREWLEQQGSSLQLSAILDEYMQLVTSFDGWLMSEFRRQTAVEIEELERQIAQHRERFADSMPDFVLDADDIQDLEIGRDT